MIKNIIKLNNLINIANRKFLSTKANYDYIEVGYEYPIEHIVSQDDLLNNLNEFFNSIDKNVEFIAIMTKIEADGGETYTLENKTILNLINNTDVDKYIKDVNKKFNEKFTEINYDPKTVLKIYFCYKEVTKDNYINFNKKKEIDILVLYLILKL